MVVGIKDCPWRMYLDLVCCSLFCEADYMLPLQNRGLKSSSTAIWSLSISYLKVYLDFLRRVPGSSHRGLSAGISHWLSLAQGQIVSVGCSLRREQHVAGQGQGTWCHKKDGGQWSLRHTQCRPHDDMVAPPWGAVRLPVGCTRGRTRCCGLFSQPSECALTTRGTRWLWHIDISVWDPLKYVNN